MRINLALTTEHLLGMILLLLLCMIPAAAQSQTRIIKWQPHPFFSRDAAGRRISDELEIVDFTVEGKPVTLGEPFAAGDEWLKTFKVRLRNISGKTITMAQMTFVLPESETDKERMLAIWLVYRNLPSENPKPIMPGEDFELTMDRLRNHEFEERIAGSRNPAIINKLFITITSAHFSDGTSWLSGCMKAVNPKNACPL